MLSGVLKNGLRINLRITKKIRRVWWSRTNSNMKIGNKERKRSEIVITFVYGFFSFLRVLSVI
jgi:hypothetical protein